MSDEVLGELRRRIRRRWDLTAARVVLAWRSVLKFWTRHGQAVIVGAVTLILFLTFFALLGSD